MAVVQNSNFDVAKFFKNEITTNENVSSAIAAIKTLLRVIKETKIDTVHILDSTVHEAVQVMRTSDVPITAVVSGSELFLRFITFGKFDDKTMEECKKFMLHRGEVFLRRLIESRGVIARQAVQFVTEGCRVLTHSRSRNVLEALKYAALAKKNFKVFVTQGGIGSPGAEMIKDLRKADVECTLVLDSSIGYVMESVDIVMVGAEGVVESGGIINRIGSFTMAVCAREMKKPFYVLAESFKFTRLYPLNQRDIPSNYKYPGIPPNSDCSSTHPEVDYTPPAYISLLFTDLGILTPSAVSDELIKLYL